VKPRARAIVIDGDRIALIERVRNGQRYYVFPGGGPHEGESLAEAAKREVYEETGLVVEIGDRVAEDVYRGVPNIFFLARVTGGNLGTGTGKELSAPPDSPSGSYRPVWIAIADLARLPVLPEPVARRVPLLAHHLSHDHRGR